MTPHARRPGLAGALLLHAAGLTSDTAAAELICAHHTWLARTDFTTSCIDAGTRHDGHPYAYIDWEHAITALDSHQLSCTPSEAAILRIAASLGLDRKTVRAWVRRWRVAGVTGLLPRYPTIRPTRLPDEVVRRVMATQLGPLLGARAA
jgi:hypothetical protein